MPAAPELPTPSTKKIMNSRNNILSKYIDAKRDRRRKARYRQKRLDLGLPAAVPLKPVSLNQEEKKAIASTEVIGTAKRKKLFVTRHFGWPISLGIHLLAAFLLTIYAIQEYIPEEPPVSLDFVEIPREPRDIERRPTIRPTTPPKTLIQAPQVRRTPTTVEIPREQARFYTPTDDLIDAGDAPTAGGVDIPEGIGDVQVEQKSVEIPTELGVKIERDSSIAPDDSELDIGADAGLGDRTIDAEVQVQVDQRPRPLTEIKPKYPEAAKRANKEAVVTVEFTVDVNGRATDIKVVEPKGFGFDEAAVEELKQTRFSPAKKGNTAVPMRVRIPIRFKLDD